jgi:hypothetical protein
VNFPETVGVEAIFVAALIGVHRLQSASEDRPALLNTDLEFVSAYGVVNVEIFEPDTRLPDTK